LAHDLQVQISRHGQCADVAARCRAFAPTDRQNNPCATGIITVEQALHAIAALEAAILKEETQDPKPLDQALGAAALSELAADDVLAKGQHVTLRQRATPLIQMLRRAHEAGQPVVWGV